MKKLLKQGFVWVIMAIMLTVCTNVFAATVGQVLTNPEQGWNRYDDTDPMLSYQNCQLNQYPDTRNWLNGTNHTTNVAGAKATVKFNFVGTQFRLLSQCNSDKRNINVNVFIDGNEYTFSSPQVLIDGHALYYESPVIPDGEHVVSIEQDQINGQYLVTDVIDIKGTLKPYAELTLGNILDIEPEKDIIKALEIVKANLVINNIKDIAAEDIRIKYDSEKLQYIGCEEIEGIKLVYKDDINGELRFILASKGEGNIINSKTTLLRLQFKGISTGEALVDIVRGRVSDGIEMEKDLTDEECDKATILIEGINDVNNSGEFTLLDLGIDARHLNKDPKAADIIQYNTDIVVNNAIDEDDLLEIGKYMLLNPTYTF